MVTPSDITGAFNNQWFSNIAEAGKWGVILIISLFLLVAIWYMFKFLEHNKKVTVFPVYGGDPERYKEAIKDGVITAEEMRGLDLQLGQPKGAKLRDYKEKGVKKSSLVIPSEIPTLLKPKVIKEVQFNYRYPDGLWMLRIDKNTFVPISRPEMDSKVMLHVPEPDMDLWEESQHEVLRLRTQDESMMKTQLIMTVGIIIGAFVLAGLIIWLSMSFAGKQINDVLTQVGPMTSALQTIAQGGSAPG